MAKYIINGGRKLNGSVNIESAKNAVLPILAGAILTDEEVIIKKVPDILDVKNMLSILKYVGVNYEFNQDTLILNSKNINNYCVPYFLTKELRSSIFMLGAFISRFKKARISYPGGCSIGKRPFDLHTENLKKLGVKFVDSDCEIVCCADYIKGGCVYLNYKSVGATENLILASVFCKGQTKIINCAKEPEIVDLANFLNTLGANISGAGTDIIYVNGVKKLHGGEYTPIPDRIVAGTYILTSLTNGGEIELKGIKEENISSFIDYFLNNTCNISIKNDIITVKGKWVNVGFNIKTGPYPQFPTDMQAQTTAMCCLCNGESVIKETVFEHRFNHVPELKKMGAKIEIIKDTLYISGVKKLLGTEVVSPDLRGGAALVLAGLNAEGTTVVDNVSLIERGYYDFVNKLKSLNADIKRIE